MKKNCTGSSTRLYPDSTFWPAKYAEAFLNVFYKSIPDDLSSRFLTLHYFFNKRKQLFVDINSPNVALDKKQDMIQSLGKALNLESNDLKLVQFLAKKGRILSLGHISKQIAKIAAHRRSEAFCEVSSSEQLKDEERSVVLSFLSKSIDKTPIVIFKVDPSIISGIRIESDCFLYEKSIKSRTREALAKLRSLSK